MLQEVLYELRIRKMRQELLLDVLTKRVLGLLQKNLIEILTDEAKDIDILVLRQEKLTSIFNGYINLNSLLSMS